MTGRLHVYLALADYGSGECVVTGVYATDTKARRALEERDPLPEDPGQPERPHSDLVWKPFEEVYGPALTGEPPAWVASEKTSSTLADPSVDEYRVEEWPVQ